MRRGRFAGSGFPDDGHGLAGINRQIDTAHSIDAIVAGAESHVQITDLEQGRLAGLDRGTHARLLRDFGSRASL
ncbi:MAG TPA: hypothetical protein VK020_08780, partial [Microlunatus sp.]|nr:hypothetical protein [Microlunatus sp.]